MIALNEILSKRDYFEQKYKLMGKKAKLEKIIKLEEKFIVLDKKASELRSSCNKLCGEFSKNLETGNTSSELLLKINNLNNETEKISKLSQRSMKKINNLLKKLPNPAAEDNILNISVKTTVSELSKNQFISKLTEFARLETSELKPNKYFYSLKKVVFKAENLPKLVHLKQTNEFLIFGDSKTINDTIEQIKEILSQNAKYLTIKSIRQLKKYSSKTLLATLSDRTFVTVDLLGEYLSRENSIKFYDKQIDMTQFVNILKISIK